MTAPQYPDFATNIILSTLFTVLLWGALQGYNAALIAWLNISGLNLLFPTIELIVDSYGLWFMTHKNGAKSNDNV
jgi:hypothetical protein